MIRLRMKKGVSLQGVRPELHFAYTIVWATAANLGATEVWLTSVRDGTHSRKSLHYSGAAFDSDVPGWTPEQIEKWAREVRDSLCDEFDVVAHKASLHVEHQPETNTRV